MNKILFTTTILVAGCGHPTVDCQPPFVLQDAGPSWLGIIHGSDGLLLVASTFTGVRWANVKSDGSLDVQGNVDVGASWPILETPLELEPTSSGFKFFTDAHAASFDLDSATSTNVALKGGSGMPAGFTLDTVFPGPDGEYGIWSVPTDGGYSAGLARVDATGTVAKVGAPTIFGADFDDTQVPLLFGGAGLDADAGALWVNAPDGKLPFGGRKVVKLSRAGALLATLDAGVTDVSNWVRLQNEKWAGLGTGRIAAFTNPADATSETHFPLDGQPESQEVERDGTLSIVGFGDGGVAVWHWHEGESSIAQANVTPLGVGFCDLVFNSF